MDAERLKEVVRARLGRRVASSEGIEAGLGTRRFLRLHFSEGEPRSLIARCESDLVGPSAGLTPATTQPTTQPTTPIQTTAPAGTSQRRVVLPSAPAWLPEPALEPLRGFLEQAGLRVPRSFGHFPELGLDLLEDVGSRSLLRADRA